MTLQADLYLKQDKRAWSERYYLGQTVFPPGFTLDTLAEGRMPLLASPAVLVSGRIVDLEGLHFPVEKEYNRRGDFAVAEDFFIFKAPHIPAGNSDLAVAMGWQSPNGGKRILWLGGAPTNIIPLTEGDRVTGLFPSLVHKLDKFRDLLLGESLQLQLKELLPPGEALTQPIDRIDVDPAGLYRVTTRNDFAGAVGSQVRILGSRGNNLTRLRGLRRITHKPDDRTLSLDRGPLAERGPVRYTGGASVVASGYRFTDAEWRPLGDTRTVTSSLFDAPGLGGPLVTKHQPFVYLLLGKLRGGQAGKRRGRRPNRR